MITVSAFDVQNSSEHACGPSAVGIFLANSASIADWDLQLGVIGIPGIAAGASVHVAQSSYTLPVRGPLLLGTDYIIVGLDWNNSIEEPDEANNYVLRPFSCVVLDRWTQVPVTLDMGGATGLPRVTALTWGDYDHDGSPDLAAADARANHDHLLHNDGSGVLTEVLPSPVSFGVGCAMWADHDNNGFVDLGGLYCNDGWGKLVYDPIDPWVGGVWADYDRDGLVDIFQSNRSQSIPVTGALYRNVGGGAFQLVQSTTAVFGSGAAWGDYDNDGA